jgi:hypothetical protein
MFDMRTTLDIDDDVLSAAKELAKAEGKTMGQVMSELARRALTAPHGFAEAQAAFATADDWELLPSREGPPVTNDLIRRIQDELDAEDAAPFDHARGVARDLGPG